MERSTAKASRTGKSGLNKYDDDDDDDDNFVSKFLKRHYTRKALMLLYKPKSDLNRSKC